jgi:hypothetical protein
MIDGAIGTKVLEPTAINPILKKAIEEFDWDSCTQKGQAFIPLPKSAFKYLSSGDGKLDGRGEDDFLVREWRGDIQMFLKREFAGKVMSAAAVVYTVNAYNRDPDVIESGDLAGEPATHVLVAVLASSGPKPELGFSRFVKNLAGGNKEFSPLTRVDDAMREFREETGTFRDSKKGLAKQVALYEAEIRRLVTKAQDSCNYNKLWGVVADPASAPVVEDEDEESTNFMITTPGYEEEEESASA